MDPFLETDIAWYNKGKFSYVDNWFLMGSPVTILVILAAYLAFVLKVGPAIMEKRPPFKLRRLLIVYNVFQVLFSLYTLEIGVSIILEYGLVSKSCLLDKEIPQKVILSANYMYFIAKLTELLDTIFFVLRKKNKQVTFLHVYHHSMMLILSWVTLKYEPTYNVTFVGTINTLVHVIMYAYYALSAFPSMEKHLWWKKYLTSFQLIQFGLMLLHVLVTDYVSHCPSSAIVYWNILFNVILMMYLFTDFYFKSYVKKSANKNIDAENEDISRHCIKNKGK